jgi:hypothetical protein
MGANSKQGWYLFLFLLGFTFLPAGLVYLGFIFTLAGLACLIAAVAGFISIRPLENSTPAMSKPEVAASVASASAAKRAI